MIENIATVIASFRGAVEPTRNDMFVASAVLKKVEKSGMKPPVRSTGWAHIPEMGGRIELEENTWEPE